ncbi:hypothetical protein LIER_19646 [Lithospermum erythrorhizon]|uniref:Uncharacterized protein n=1 Tax=Lithospermum erythrorhizon TaxID=34254 RepID=A0AAV3QLH6_LITER
MVKADETPFTVEKYHFDDNKYYRKKNKPQHKEGPEALQMPLASQIATSALQKVEEDIVEALKGLTLPVTQLPPPKGFVTLKEGPQMEHVTMGPKSFDLLRKADYDFTKDKAMGQLPPEVIGDKVHRLNDIQKMIREKGWPIKNPTMGLAYTSKPPLRALIKRVTNHYIAEVKK